MLKSLIKYLNPYICVISFVIGLVILTRPIISNAYSTFDNLISLPYNFSSGSQYGVSYIVNDDGSISFRGTSTHSFILVLNSNVSFSGNYYLIGGSNGISLSCGSLVSNSSFSVVSGSLSGSFDIVISVSSGFTFDNTIIVPLLRSYDFLFSDFDESSEFLYGTGYLSYNNSSNTSSVIVNKTGGNIPNDYAFEYPLNLGYAVWTNPPYEYPSLTFNDFYKGFSFDGFFDVDFTSNISFNFGTVQGNYTFFVPSFYIDYCFLCIDDFGFYHTFVISRFLSNSFNSLGNYFDDNFSFTCKYYPVIFGFYNPSSWRGISISRYPFASSGNLYLNVYFKNYSFNDISSVNDISTYVSPYSSSVSSSINTVDSLATTVHSFEDNVFIDADSLAESSGFKSFDFSAFTSDIIFVATIVNNFSSALPQKLLTYIYVVFYVGVISVLIGSIGYVVKNNSRVSGGKRFRNKDSDKKD